MDLRRQQIAQTVKEVQEVVHRLTAEISHQDSRFQAVSVSDTYNDNIKVSRALLSEGFQEAPKPMDGTGSMFESGYLAG